MIDTVLSKPSGELFFIIVISVMLIAVVGVMAIELYYLWKRGNKMYEIYITQGQDKVLVEKVPSLNAAVKYVDEHKEEGSFGIKCPNGKWYEW